MKVKKCLLVIMLASSLFSTLAYCADQTQFSNDEILLDVKICARTDVYFEEAQFDGADFVRDGGVMRCGKSLKWFCVSNEEGAKYSIMGRLLETLGSGVSLKCHLSRPENTAIGQFGVDATSGRELLLTTENQEFVKDIPSGYLGDMQNQSLTLEIDVKEFSTKLLNSAICWTVSSEN